MRFLLLFLSLAFVSVAFAQAPVISPAAPAVNQGATQTFTCTANCGGGGTWTCTGTDNTGAGIACHGSIGSVSGIYTAPASVTAQQTEGGFQLLPNNHIFNTRIDSLAVNANNATWMAAVNVGGAPYGVDTWTGKPVNYINNATPSESMTFFYGGGVNNGSFQVPQYPDAKLESGYFNARYGNPFNVDHHLLSINTQTGVLSDFYQYYPSLTTTAASVNGSNVATLTVPLDTTKNIFVSGESVCVGGFTGADTYFNVCPVTLSSVTATTISYSLTHAIASATTNGKVTANTQVGNCSALGTCNSQSGVKYNYSDYALPVAATDAAGMELQPLILRLQELERAVATGGTINHAIRLTYGLGFECSCFIWPATANAVDGGTVPFGARVRLKSSYNISGFSAIAQVLLKQMQQYGMINSDGGINWDSDGESNAWPASYVAAMTEVHNAANLTNNMEFVDESSLMVSSTSGLTTLNREIVTFTRTSDSVTASVDVALQGVAVNFASDYLYIQAGTPAQPLTALVNIGGITWTMSPSVGTLTSGGLYTPPATLGATTTTTITATSTTNAAVAAQMNVVVYPESPIRIIPSQDANFTDSLGNVWTGGYTGTSQPGTRGCCASGNYPAGTDFQLWNAQIGYSSANPPETRVDITVPNGTYRIIYHYGTAAASGVMTNKISQQGTVFFDGDLTAAAGGLHQPYTNTVSGVTVTNNKLSFVIWHINSTSGPLGAPLSSLQITQTSGAAQRGIPTKAVLW